LRDRAGKLKQGINMGGFIKHNGKDYLENFPSLGSDAQGELIKESNKRH
jgi:hypothetical protein